MDIQYTCCEDYLIPDFAINVKIESIGKYRRMRLHFLEEHRPDLYQQIVLSGQLHTYLAEIDRVCHKRLEHMIRDMAETEGIDEGLKAANQLGWISRMNSIKGHTEEAIIAELIFA
ncbi:MAG: TnpV protein [Eubacterium sp.]|nr:TnpV protein [Eubacterium sp.]